MATQRDVRRIAMALPEVEEGTERFAFSVRGKGVAWVWLERLHPRQGRVPNPKVLAVRVRSLTEKDLMIAADPVKFFTEPHYNGYPAVLVRLDAVRAADLRPLLLDAWRCVAPRDLVKALEETSTAKRGAASPRPDTSAAPTTRASRARSGPAPRGRGTGARSSRRS